MVRELTVPLPLHLRDRGSTRVLASLRAWWCQGRGMVASSSTHGFAHGRLVRPSRPTRGNARLFVPTERGRARAVRTEYTINGIDARNRRKRPSQHSFIVVRDIEPRGLKISRQPGPGLRTL